MKKNVNQNVLNLTSIFKKTLDKHAPTGIIKTVMHLCDQCPEKKRG